MRADEFIPMTLVENWTERCNGESICLKSKTVLNARVKDVNQAVIFAVTVFDLKREEF